MRCECSGMYLLAVEHSLHLDNYPILRLISSLKSFQNAEALMLQTYRIKSHIGQSLSFAIGTRVRYN
jgi:hypothetical protein